MQCELPIFFVCVRTNVGYSVVAQFIVQSESVECIAEALNVLEEWNFNWKPPIFLCDYIFRCRVLCTEAGISYSTTVYGCDFHREQAWTQWVQDRKNALDQDKCFGLLQHNANSGSQLTPQYRYLSYTLPIQQHCGCSHWNPSCVFPTVN